MKDKELSQLTIEELLNKKKQQEAKARARVTYDKRENYVRKSERTANLLQLHF